MHDPRVGRFFATDPLEKKYPWYTPYQFSGNKVIQFVELEGLEEAPSKAQILLYETQYKAELKTFNARLAVISTRGTVDALYNASTGGLYDVFGGNHIDDYDDPSEQNAYLVGRMLGDLAAMAQGMVEIEAGATTAVVAGASGGGLVVGGAVALHGVTTLTTATVDYYESNSKKNEIKKSNGSGGSSESSMLGSKGTKTASTTVWKQKGSKARIDVENPSPGKRPGQVHYQDSNNKKYLYDINKKKFFSKNAKGDFDVPAPKSVDKLLENKDFKSGINKALEYLGETK